MIIQYEVKHTSALYNPTVEGMKLSTGITMHIAYFNISHQHKIASNTKPYWDIKEYNNGNYKWEDVFQYEHLVAT